MFSQNISKLVSPNTKYGFGAFVKPLQNPCPAGSNLQISIKGTGYSTVNIFNADPNTLAFSFDFYSSFFNTPAIIPADLHVEVYWTSMTAIASASGLIFDEFQVQKAIVFGYASYALYRGTVDFQVNDFFTVTTANNYAGLFQTYMGRFFKTALPSSGGPTITDAWAS